MARERWTEERIRELSAGFSSRTEFRSAYRGGYKAAMAFPGLLDELFGNKKFVWSKDDLVAEAAKYGTKAQFRAGSNGAYVTCLTKFPGLIDEVYTNQIKYWKDEQLVLEEAKKYKDRREFRLKASGAAKAAYAKFPHIVEQVFGPASCRTWDLRALIDEAGLYDSRSSFKESSGGAYMAFSRFPGELDRLFHPKYRCWENEEDIRLEAGKYRTKAEFVTGCVSAYGAALRLGIIDDLGFEPGLTGFDTTTQAYLYVASVKLKSGGSGTVFGITNRTPKTRYSTDERQHMEGMKAFLFHNGADALKCETMLRRAFMRFSVAEGQSPLQFKKGTAGEMLDGVEPLTVLHALQIMCTPLPEIEDW